MYPGTLRLSTAPTAPAIPSTFSQWQRWAPWVILLLAAVLRVAWLDVKPAHFDEGINGWFADGMLQQGFYKYNPKNYHGPLHFYIEFISLRLFGRNLWALRMPVVLASLLVVWLAWAFRRHLGDKSAILAMLGIAVSPGFVFYGRYAIHETWLVLFLMLLVWGIFEMKHFGTRAGMLAFVTGIVGTVLTKETYLIHFIAAALASFATCAWGKAVPLRNPQPTASQLWSGRNALQAAALALFALLFFYSGNFFHWQGVQGMVTTFSAWGNTGMDITKHAKTDYQWLVFNYYWLWLGLKYEVLMLVGLYASSRALGIASWTTRWLAFYALAGLCGYTLISYKTPWCIISLAWPFYLLAGIPLKRLLFTRRKKIFGALAIITLAYTTARTLDLNFQNYDNDKEEYVYVQTKRDVNKALGPILAAVRRDPSILHLRGRIHLESYFPLPWILGDFPRLSCPKPDDYLKNEDSAFLITDATRRAAMISHLKEAYYIVPFDLRGGVDPCVAFFNAAIFAPEFQNRLPNLAAKTH